MISFVIKVRKSIT